MDKLFRRIDTIRATVNMPELYLDQDWNILGHSHNFFSLTKSIVGYARNKANVKSLLGDNDFVKIKKYLENVRSLQDLPYAKGEKWQLRYKGPLATEKIGKDWIVYHSCKDVKWVIKEDGGKQRIIHRPHIYDEADCYLFYRENVCQADEDIKVSYKIRTSKEAEHIRDISLIFSESTGDEKVPPGLLGYAASSASSGNTEARLQKEGATIDTASEVLEPDTEYQITVERTGGKFSRKIRNPRTSQEFSPLEMIDRNPTYDRQKYIGFYTYSGAAEIFDIEVHTRESIFSIDQFRVPFDVEVSLKDKLLENKIFKLRLGEINRDGEIVYTLMFEDVTALRQTEIAVQESEEKFHILLETMNEGMGITDENFILTYANRKYGELLGYTQSEMVGCSIRNFVAEEAQQELKNQMEMRRKGKTESYETIHLRKDGGKVYTIVSPKPVFDGNGHFKGSYAIITDITERKKVEKEFEKSRQDLRNLSAHLQTVREEERKRISREIHDELGQELTALKMDIALLAKEIPEQQKNLIEQTKSISELVGTLLSTVSTVRLKFKGQS